MVKTLEQIRAKLAEERKELEILNIQLEKAPSDKERENIRDKIRRLEENQFKEKKKHEVKKLAKIEAQLEKSKEKVEKIEKKKVKKQPHLPRGRGDIRRMEKEDEENRNFFEELKGLLKEIKKIKDPEKRKNKTDLLRDKLDSFGRKSYMRGEFVKDVKESILGGKMFPQFIDFYLGQTKLNLYDALKKFKEDNAKKIKKLRKKIAKFERDRSTASLRSEEKKESEYDFEVGDVVEVNSGRGSSRDSEWRYALIKKRTENHFYVQLLGWKTKERKGGKVRTKYLQLRKDEIQPLGSGKAKLSAIAKRSIEEGGKDDKDKTIIEALIKEGILNEDGKEIDEKDLFGEDEKEVVERDDIDEQQEELEDEDVVEMTEEEKLEALKKKLVKIRPSTKPLVEEENIVIDHIPKPWVDQSCIRRYTELPWIENGFGATIWVSEPDNNPLDKTYIHENDTKEVDGKVWYRANARFIELLCGINKDMRKQDKDKLILYDNDKNILTFNVAYETRDKFLVQNETLFNQELEWFKNRLKNVQDQIKDVLKSPFENYEKMVRQYTLKRLENSLGGDHLDYARDIEESIYDKIKNNESSKVGDYIQDFVNIYLFLGDYYLEDYTQTFRSRVLNELFLPDILPELPLTEKMPEIFDDPRVEEKTKENVEGLIKRRTKQLIDDMGYNLYVSRESLPRRRHRDYQLSPNIDLPPPRKCDIGDDESWDTIFYSEGDETHCFSIISLLDRFSNEQYDNPHTKKRFSKSFIDKIELYYQPLIEEKKEEKKEEEVEDKIDEKEFAPGFLELIKEDIEDREEELAETPSHDSGKKEGEKEGEKEGNDEIPEDWEEVTLKGDVTKEDICEYCKKHLNPESIYRSVIEHKKGSKIVEFCSAHCFEDADGREYWP